MNVYKIGSGDIIWIEFIKYIAKKNKPLLIACGASNLKDVIRVIESVFKINKKICLMQCNTNYTVSKDNFKFINLKNYLFYFFLSKIYINVKKNY